MTEERKNQLFSVAFENEDIAKKTLAMSPSEMVVFMKEKGYDYSEEEIIEAGQELQSMVDAVKNGELDESELENVFGGICGEQVCFWGGVATGIIIGGMFILGW